MCLSYEELEKIVKQTAGCYSRSIFTMSREDLEQELWLLLWTKKPQEERQARKYCLNRCTDIYRKAKRGNSVILVGKISDEEGERSSYVQTLEKQETKDRSEFEELANKLRKIKTDRDRRYAIAKAYLECDIVELEEDFYEMYKDLTAEQKEKVANKKKLTNADIVTIFTGLSGNSASVCVMKQHIRNEVFGK